MKWTNDELIRLKECLANGVSGYELYEKIKEINRERTYEAVCRQARRQGASNKTEVHDSLYELVGLVDQLVKNHKGRKPIPRVDEPTEGESSVLVLPLSDFHLGALVTYQGNVLYDMNIARARIESVIIQAGKIAEEFDVDRIVMVALGDIMDNEVIYKTQPHNVCASVSDQLVAGTEFLLNAIDYLTGIVPVEFYGVRGNHGRVSLMANEKANWDTALYKLLNLIHLRSGSRVPFVISSEEDLDFDILGWRIHARHEGKQQSATPAGRAGFLGWTIIHDADIILSAHYHNAQYSSFGTRSFIQNGSLVGPNDLSGRMAVISTPHQWGIIMSNKKCIKQLIPIVAEGETR